MEPSGKTRVVALPTGAPVCNCGRDGNGCICYFPGREKPTVEEANDPSIRRYVVDLRVDKPKSLLDLKAIYKALQFEELEYLSLEIDDDQEFDGVLNVFGRTLGNAYYAKMNQTKNLEEGKRVARMEEISAEFNKEIMGVMNDHRYMKDLELLKLHVLNRTGKLPKRPRNIFAGKWMTTLRAIAKDAIMASS